MTRARASLAALSAIAVAALAAIAFPAPAGAAPLGSVKLSKSTGTVDQNPIFGSASASRPCPTGYGSDAMVRIGPPGGPYSNVAKPVTDGGYDKKAVSVKPNRSFTTALAGAPKSGEWWVVVECYSETLGMHQERFITPITVNGRRWKLGPPVKGAAPLDAPPQGQPVPPTVPGPEVTGAAPVGTEGAPGPDVTGGATVDPRLASNDRSGEGSPLSSVLWTGGVLLVLALVGGVALFSWRRRMS
ncbi:hypothetical protein ACTMTJ_26150 [Phytohabitans sp. LJ34]|uniref:hypothetical protein n=1 Tax=Phytohabitans sp. LJ34 TaxID=3452217 RepID=UPI003F8B25C7